MKAVRYYLYTSRYKRRPLMDANQSDTLYRKLFTVETWPIVAFYRNSVMLLMHIVIPARFSSYLSG